MPDMLSTALGRTKTPAPSVFPTKTTPVDSVAGKVDGDAGDDDAVAVGVRSIVVVAASSIVAVDVSSTVVDAGPIVAVDVGPTVVDGVVVGKTAAMTTIGVERTITAVAVGEGGGTVDSATTVGLTVDVGDWATSVGVTGTAVSVAVLALVGAVSADCPSAVEDQGAVTRMPIDRLAITTTSTIIRFDRSMEPFSGTPSHECPDRLIISVRESDRSTKSQPVRKRFGKNSPPRPFLSDHPT